MPSRKPVKAVHIEQADLQGLLGLREGNRIFVRENGTAQIEGATPVEDRAKARRPLKDETQQKGRENELHGPQYLQQQ
jgi:hypothetical protein